MKKYWITQLLFIVFSITAFSAATPSQKVLFVRKDGAQFSQVFNAMKKDLEKKYLISEYVLEPKPAYDVFKSKMKQEKPALVVLMDNQSVNFGNKYNAEQTAAPVKGVALMGLNYRSFLKGNPHFSGIAFEPPAYTLVTQFRFFVEKPIKNILVFYRKSVFQETIDVTRQHLNAEGIKLHSVDAEQEGKDNVQAFVKKHFKALASDPKKFDAVWVLLDSVLLSPDLFQNVWLETAKQSKVPFITGIEDFVSKDFNFGVFAVTPNLPDLASQANQMVSTILDDHVEPKDIGVEELIAVNKYLNVAKLKELKITLKKDRDLSEVKVIE